MALLQPPQDWGWRENQLSREIPLLRHMCSRSQDCAEGSPSTKQICSRSQMKRQNSEVCTVGAKVFILKRRRLAWGNVGKGLNEIRSRNPEDPQRKVWIEQGTNIVLARSWKLERKPTSFGWPRKYNRSLTKAGVASSL